MLKTLFMMIRKALLYPILMNERSISLNFVFDVQILLSILVDVVNLEITNMEIKFVKKIYHQETS